MFKKVAAVEALVVIIVMVVVATRKHPDGALKLGAAFPLTGEVASYGQKGKRGIEVAVEEWNAKGGVLGRQVSIDFQDDRNDKKEAVGIMTKFATVDKVPVVFGSAGSSVTLAIAPLATKHKVLLVSPISSSAELSTKGGPFFFRTVPADDVQAVVLAKWVNDSGAERVAVVYTNNSWGKPLADGFESNFKDLGGEVLLSEGAPEGSSNFRTIIAKLKQLTDLDAIVSPTYPKEGGAFVRQVKELGMKAALFGGDNWGAPEFLKIAGSAAEGVFYTAPSDTHTGAYGPFAKSYQSKYGEQPDVFSAYAYDAATAVFKAIEAAKSVDPTAARDALRNLTFTGVSGEISFQGNGDLKSEAFATKTIKDGKPISATQ